MLHMFSETIDAERNPDAEYNSKASWSCYFRMDPLRCGSPRPGLLHATDEDALFLNFSTTEIPDWLPLETPMRLHLTSLFLRQQKSPRKKFTLFSKSVCNRPPNMTVEFRRSGDEQRLLAVLSRRKGFSLRTRRYEGEVSIDSNDDYNITNHTVRARMRSQHHVFTLMLLHPVTIDGALMAGTLRKVNIKTDKIQLWSVTADCPYLTPEG